MPWSIRQARRASAPLSQSRCYELVWQPLVTKFGFQPDFTPTIRCGFAVFETLRLLHPRTQEEEWLDIGPREDDLIFETWWFVKRFPVRVEYDPNLGDEVVAIQPTFMETC